MLPSEQHHSLGATSSTTTTTSPNNMLVADVIDDSATSDHRHVLTFRHKPPRRRIMAPQRLEGRDQSETSQATSSSCGSASTAVTAAADDSSFALPPLHRALRDYALDALLANNTGSRAAMEREILLLITSETARVFDETGHLPLHIACQAGVPFTVVERLVTAYPAALRLATRNQRQLLPLHILCKSYAGLNRERSQLLALLLRSYPEATRIATARDGELPLHLLCHNYFCSTANLALVLKYYPDAIATASKRRQNLPLHIACEKKYMVKEVVCRSPKRGNGGMVEDEPGSSSDEIIQFLVQKCRQSVTMVNGKGELPFHAAVRGYQSLDTLRLLLQAHPTALTATDAHGRTPLHLAVSRPEPCRLTIRALLETDPAAPGSAVDRDGQTPIDYANRHPDPSVRNLMLQHITTEPVAAVAKPVISAQTW